MNRLATVAAILGVVLTMLLFSTSHKSAKAATTIPDPAVDEKLSSQKGQAKVVLAGGCFWGLQAVFEHVKGVKHVTAGYSGGTLKNPSYEEVSSGQTGHAESIEIEFDPSKVTVGMLLKVFFSVAHNPTELNRQGPDTGTQYRSAIFYENEEQQRIAQAYVDQLNAAKVFSGPIVTQILPFQAFYR
ncbi:MAG: peptide-methionine (S)-S-oxide reductase MsrA, partial [Candidatus Acidiferrum sp.]